MFPMMIRCHIFGKKNCEGPKGWENDDTAPWYDPKGKYGKEIPGAIVNGYTEQELRQYFHDIEGFASYAFNRSHAATYSALSVITAWLKHYYPAEFMAAFLTMADDDKKEMAINVCHQMGIKLAVPDINISKHDFTPQGKTILYGLSAVKSVGDSAIPAIIENAPYESLEDALEKIPKKNFNKRVAANLIKAGAFDNLYSVEERVSILQRMLELRKDKEGYSDDRPLEEIIMEFENDTLGTHVTFHSWWEDLKPGKNTTLAVNIKNVSEKLDKNGGLMAFVTLEKDNIEFEAIVFASKYRNLAGLFDMKFHNSIKINGKKTEKGTFVVNDATP